MNDINDLASVQRSDGVLQRTRGIGRTPPPARWGDESRLLSRWANGTLGLPSDGALSDQRMAPEPNKSSTESASAVRVSGSKPQTGVSLGTIPHLRSRPLSAGTNVTVVTAIMLCEWPFLRLLVAGAPALAPNIDAVRVVWPL